jgi:hypothetical protein
MSSLNPSLGSVVSGAEIVAAHEIIHSRDDKTLSLFEKK